MSEEQPKEKIVTETVEVNKLTEEELKEIDRQIEEKYNHIAKVAVESTLKKQEELKQQDLISNLQKELDEQKRQTEILKQEYQDKMTAISEKLVQRKSVVDTTNPVEPPIPQSNGKIQISEQELEKQFLERYGLNKNSA